MIANFYQSFMKMILVIGHVMFYEEIKTTLGLSLGASCHEILYSGLSSDTCFS